MTAIGKRVRLVLWCTTFDEAEIKKAMLGAGVEVIIIADSSKFRGRSLAKIEPIKQRYQLITDQGLEAETRLKLQELIQDGLIIAAEGVNRNEIRASEQSHY